MGLTKYNAMRQMAENMTLREGEIRFTEDWEKAIILIESEMGEWHAYYARAAIKEKVANALTVKVDDKVLGAIIYYQVKGTKGNVVVIYYIATSKEARRKGIASLLLSELEKRIKPNAMLATISHGNTPSITFFAKHGFEVISYEEVKRKYGPRFLRKISRLACGYEDEYAAVKPVKYGWHIIDSVDDSLVEGIFREICYKPWKQLRLKG